MEDRHLCFALAAAARGSIAVLERGGWPNFPEDVESPDPRLVDTATLDVRWANAVCEFLGDYFFDAAHGDRTWASLPPDEARGRVGELLEQLEKGHPIEDPVILAWADPRRWPPPQRRPFGGRP